MIGNDFAHKYVEPTVTALRAAFPGQKIVALGLERTSAPDVAAYASGRLPDEQVDRLFEQAACVVYPSIYEGFGFPVVEALARSKPILARDLPPTREIRARLRAEDNLLLYASTAELVDRLRAGLPEWRETGRLRRDYAENNWEAIAGRLQGFLADLVANVSMKEVLIPRIEHFRRLKLLDIAGGDNPPVFSDALAELAALRRMLRDREDQVAALRNSISWKLAAPLRAVYDLILRLQGK